MSKGRGGGVQSTYGYIRKLGGGCSPLTPIYENWVGGAVRLTGGGGGCSLLTAIYETWGGGGGGGGAVRLQLYNGKINESIQHTSILSMTQHVI